VSASPAADIACAKAAAGALFFDERGRVMLVRPTYKPFWDIPGGYVEPGETPQQACLREVEEELSLRVKLGRPLVVDWAPHPDEGDMVLFIFDGGRLTHDQHAAIHLQADELGEYRYVEPAEVAALTVPRLTRRVLAAVDAHRSDSTLYLEHGAQS